MFLGILTTKKYIGKLIILEIKELIKATTINFVLTGTIRMGFVIKETSMPFENNVDCTTFIDQTK